MARYSLIADNTNSENGETIVVVQRYPRLYARLATTLVLMGLVAATIYAFRGASLWPQSEQPSITSCGATPSEAQSRGCHFDITSFSWLPPACHDDDLVAEFLALERWEWFLDPAGTQSIPLEEVERGEMAQMYVSWKYHLAHCVFMWQKLHRAVDKGQVIDAYIGNYHHTSHCGHMLMKAENGTTLNTIIRRKYVGCGVDEVLIT